ncbi:glutamine synthetase family protein [Steroidobacter sp.]|uniref:glutamine synthetase family protein n=1 Tax=Steroidobacter sp. TaxID=1978227 RepID=UPI001A4D4280|nr:glutamine synthetase [Steroidobacter sp.]
MTPDQLQQAVRDGQIDTVVVCMTDLQGRLIGKRLTARFFVDTGFAPQMFCDYLLATDMEMTLVDGFEASSWSRGYGDLALVPDMNTLRAVPWLPGTAIVLADVTDQHGKPLAHSPRQILKHQLDRLAALGVEADMAAEYEFYLFNMSFEEARAVGYRALKPASWYPQDGHVFQSSKDEPVIRRIRNLMDQADIPIEGSKAEWSAGQQEINLQYCEALEMADRLALYKNGCKEIAQQNNQAVSFMAKLDDSLAGSSFHIHLSLRDRVNGRAVFLDEQRPLAMSRAFEHFLAGALEHAPAATYFWAPYINSYRRFRAGTFAPTRIAWSVDNRTTSFRVLGSGRSLRFECRVPGADVNPYLAFAALLAAGLAGLEAQLSLPPAFNGDCYQSGVPSIPVSLPAALAQLESSTVFGTAFGVDVIRHYLHCGRWEWAQSEAGVTDWERIRYFERV